MPDLADMTSPVRVALSRLIASRAMTDRELAARLEVDLAAVGFEDMTHAALIEMARAYGVPESQVADVTSKCSAEMSRVSARYHCGVCTDVRLIGNDVDGWLPCPNCNVVPADAVFDPASC